MPLSCSAINIKSFNKHVHGPFDDVKGENGYDASCDAIPKDNVRYFD